MAPFDERENTASDPVAPRGFYGATSQRTVDKIAGDVKALITTPEMREVFLREGAEPAPMQPAQFARTIRDEIEGWEQVARKANIRPE